MRATYKCDTDRKLVAKARRIVRKQGDVQSIRKAAYLTTLDGAAYYGVYEYRTRFDRYPTRLLGMTSDQRVHRLIMRLHEGAVDARLDN